MDCPSLLKERQLCTSPSIIRFFPSTFELKETPLFFFFLIYAVDMTIHRMGNVWSRWVNIDGTIWRLQERVWGITLTGRLLYRNVGTILRTWIYRQWSWLGLGYFHKSLFVNSFPLTFVSFLLNCLLLNFSTYWAGDLSYISDRFDKLQSWDSRTPENPSTLWINDQCAIPIPQLTFNMGN